MELTTSALNATDAAYISIVIVDEVSEQGVVITDLNLYDGRANDREDLTYLSVSSHQAYGGNTRVLATLSVSGTGRDSVQSVTLEIIQWVGLNAIVRATAPVTSLPSGFIGTPFSASNNFSRTVTTPIEILIPSSQLAAIEQTLNGTVSARLRVTTSAGRQALKWHWSALQKRRWYAPANRYSDSNDGPTYAEQRELGNCLNSTTSEAIPCGGDSWALPTSVARSMGLAHPDGLLYGNFSNMNTGRFPPHTSHDVGIDVDVVFGQTVDTSFFAPTADNAHRVIALLNSPLGTHINFIYVQYSTTPGQNGYAFWNVIRDATLNDGITRIIPIEIAVNGPTQTARQGRV